MQNEFWGLAVRAGTSQVIGYERFAVTLDRWKTDIPPSPLEIRRDYYHAIESIAFPIMAVGNDLSMTNGRRFESFCEWFGESTDIAARSNGAIEGAPQAGFWPSQNGGRRIDETSWDVNRCVLFSPLCERYGLTFNDRGSETSPQNLCKHYALTSRTRDNGCWWVSLAWRRQVQLRNGRNSRKSKGGGAEMLLEENGNHLRERTTEKRR
ncbi:uncharacterized protein BDR25DRAFT_357480 [Lindgomyces ingoldianus]|uniref:Uncharacterized protein n=1 Tax=Lindgomyces ingoldianus TaxID=673940 RepID=A0ACB6QNS1_9PLEO|nr:uncharacterized protein BDR25DRAFT_357480 [Lindgomyces ingoldianus]KAF2468556.1 hypothetical protein BDR25DRAFT_357480 [Lindgomyces ingoldianus]